MATKTGEYWQDLNLAIYESLSKIRKTPSVYQLREISHFMMHVLEKEEGITESDLRFRTNFEGTKFFAIKETLLMAGLILIKTDRFTQYAEEDTVNVRPSEKVMYLVRKNYYAQNGNFMPERQETLKLSEEAEADVRETAPIIEIPTEKEKMPISEIAPKSEKKAPENTAAKTREHARRKTVVPTTTQEIAYKIVIGKGRILEIQEELDKKAKQGINVKKLFQKWKIDYNEESVQRLILYLEINKVKYSMEGTFPNIKLHKKLAEQNVN